jgi:hypothetical protein
MYATWPMVFGALVAGTLAGVMIPERPASSPSAVTEWAHGKSGTGNKTNTAKPPESKPASPVTETAGSPALKAAEVKPAVAPAAATQNSAARTATQTDAASSASCETEKWPYRTSNCLDRTAAVLPAKSLAKTKRVDPTISMKSTNPNEGSREGTKQVAEDKPTPKPEKEKEKKTASIAPQEEETEQKRSAAPRAETDDREIRSEPAPRRTTQRRVTTRRAPEPGDEYTGRVYYRDQSGRLYLAPELRHQLPPPPGFWR